MREIGVPGGVFFCKHCLQTSRRCLYKVPGRGIVFEVLENNLKRYKVICIYGAKEFKSFYKVKVTKWKGLPLEISMELEELNGKSSYVTLDRENRICIECFKNDVIRFLPLNAGYYPCVNITLIGKTSVGKTQFVYSSIYRSNKMYESGIVPLNELTGKPIPVGATPWQARETCTEFALINKKGEIEALINLFDVPGELFGSRKNEYSAADVAFHKARVQIADALLYFLDERDISGMKAEQEEPGSIQQNQYLLMSSILQSKRETPISVIMTKADAIRNYVCDHGAIRAENGASLINTRYSWFSQVPSGKERNRELAKYLKMNKTILQKICPYLQLWNQKKKVQYFMASSGSATGAKNVIDYSKAYNNVLPMLYVLNQLGLVDL